MVDYHLSVVFQALRSENNYLRIWDDTLTRHLSSVDVADKQNLVNLKTGRVESSKHESNEEALTRFAKLLSEEKWLRLARSPHGHTPKPKPNY